jgi:O-antigen ligase
MNLTAISAAAQVGGPARRTQLFEALVFWLFVAGLAWVPFWHGGNEAIAWCVNAMLFPGLAILYETGLLLRGKPHQVGLRNILLPAALFLVLVLWIELQNATGLLPDAANPAWKMAGEALGSSPPGSISVNRDLTAVALLRLITGASVFWLALQLCRDARRARTFVGAIALIGAAYAAYGLMTAKTGWLRMPDTPQGGAVSATFINPDSYAVFAGIGFLATAEMLLRQFQRYGVGAFGNPRRQLAVLAEMTGRDGAPVLAGGFTILAALLLTGSRGGIAATGLAVIALAVLARRNRARGEPVSWPVLFLGLVCIAGTGLLFGTVVSEKVAGAGFFDPNRLAAYRLTLQSIVDQPWFGWGYGTFVDVFPMYRDGSITGSGTWSQAHNTYLEALQGLGIVVGSIFVALVVLLVFRCCKGSALRRENAMVPRFAVAAAILVGAHALIDFSLQIQAVALTFAALLGSGVAQAESSRISLEDQSAGPLDGGTIRVAGAHAMSVRASWQKWLTAFVILALCAGAALQGWGLARSTTRSRDADETRKPSVPDARPELAGKTVRRWLGIPGLGGTVFELPLAQIALIDPELGEQRATELGAVLAARPLSPQAWLSLAVFRLVARERLPSVVAALRMSWVTGPHEGSVLWQRGVFGLAVWDFLPADAGELTTRDIARAIREDLVADRQLTAVTGILGAKPAETRALIRALLERQGLSPADLARIGLSAD